MKQYAQIDLATGRVTATLQTSGEVNEPHMIEVQDASQAIGKRWNGAAFESIVPTQAEQAAADLAQIDRDTGMSRTLRETLIALAAKVGADASFLAAKEAQAAAARAKLK